MVSSVLIDFDGTIALEDTTDLLLEQFADPGWRAVEDDWVAGRIGSRECLSQQIDLVQASAADIDQLADGVSVDTDFADFVAAGQALGLHMVIGSDGFDRIIERVLKRIGITLPVVNNRLVPIEGGRWRAEFPNFLGDCRSQSGNCKCALFPAKTAMILVGDGRSDFCPAAQASLVFAKKTLAAHCKASGIDHIQIQGFAHATLALRAFCKPSSRATHSPNDKTGAVHA